MKWSKKLLVLLLTVFLIQGCGSDNNNEGEEVVTVTNNTPVNPWNPEYVNPGVTSFAAFKEQVDAGHFRGLSNYNYINYIHCEVVINTIGSWSDWFDGFFDISFTWNSWNSSRCGGNTQYDIIFSGTSGTVSGHRHGSSVETIHNFLKDVVNGPIHAIQRTPTAFEVFKNGNTYLIDLAKPLVANPVMEFPVNGYLQINGNGYQYVGTSLAY